jgi:hypothetical protein
MTPGLAEGLGEPAIGGIDGEGLIETGSDGVGSGGVDTGGRLGEGKGGEDRTGGVTAGRLGVGTGNDGTDGSGVGNGGPATVSTCPSIAALVKWAEAEIGKNRTAAQAYARSSTGVRSKRHEAWYLPHRGEPCTQIPSPLPFEPSANCDKSRTSRQ